MGRTNVRKIIFGSFLIYFRRFSANVCNLSYDFFKIFNISGLEIFSRGVILQRLHTFKCNGCRKSVQTVYVSNTKFFILKSD